MQHRIIDRRYKIVKTIGSGATGTVYKVYDVKDKRILALKILSKKTLSSTTIQHFKREFTLLARLHHPHLCAVYDFGTLRDGRNYFTMEYIDGENIFKASQHKSYQEIYTWVVQLCRVLEYIHAKGLIHYDIKPGNVLIAKAQRSNSPVVKLMDFGLAGESRLSFDRRDEQKIKGGTLIRGTFPYIAPEMLKGLSADHRADLYSLGVLLYELFTRKLIRRRCAPLNTMLKENIEREFKRPSMITRDIPKQLDSLIMRLLNSEPSARFSSANVVIKKINAFSRIKYKLETAQTIEGYLLSSKFVGRDKELNLLKSLYERTREGKGSLVLITGDAGIGKSRLLKEFKVFTQFQGSPYFIGYAHGNKTKPLEPFYDIFKELLKYLDKTFSLKLSLAVLFKIFPDLAGDHLKRRLPKLAPLEPHAERLRTFEALSEFIRFVSADLGGFVILLEDIHWADDLSIQFLEYLGRNLKDRNIFICVTCRSEELINTPVLKKMVVDLSGTNYFTRIELHPLQFKSLYSFLDSMITPESNSLELTRYLMKKTGGNPFFVEEIMRTFLLKEKMNIGERLEIKNLEQIAVAKEIEDVVLKRIDDLDKNCQRVIKLGSIILKEFSYDLMKQLTGLDDISMSKTLWDLKKRQVLIEDDHTYRFYHATLREAVHKRLRNRERRDFNHQVGRALEKVNRGRLSEIIEDLAYYFINARHHYKGIKYGLRAARKSRERYDYERAIKFYKDMLTLLSDKDIKSRYCLLNELGNVEVITDNYDDAVKHYNKASSLRVGTIEEEIKVLLGIGNVYARKGEYTKTLRICKRGLRILKKMKPGRLKTLLKTDINVSLCKAFIKVGDFEKANKFSLDDLEFLKYERGKEAARLLVDVYNNLAAIESYKGFHGKVDYNKAIFAYKQVYKYSRRLKSEGGITGALNNLGICYHYTYDFNKAFDCYQRVARISEKIGDQYNLSIGLLNMGYILMIKGRYSNAIKYFQRIFSISEKIGNPSIKASSIIRLGLCYYVLCDYEKAKQYLLKALRIFETIDWQGEKAIVLRIMGEIYQSMGRYTHALRFYRRALKIFKDINHQRKISDIYIDFSSVFIEIREFSKANKYIADAFKIITAIQSKENEIDYYIMLCRANLITQNYTIAYNSYMKGRKLAEKTSIKIQILQLLLLGAEACYCMKRYSRGIRIANASIKMANDMGTQDLHVKALVLKTKNEIAANRLSETEAYRILNEAKRIAEKISNPEILWKTYFEYGKFLQNNKRYRKALDYYQKCNEIFEDVGSNIENKSYKQSYLNHPDRQAVFTATTEIEKLLH